MSLRFYSGSGVSYGVDRVRAYGGRNWGDLLYLRDELQCKA